MTSRLRSCVQLFALKPILSINERVGRYFVRSNRRNVRQSSANDVISETNLPFYIISCESPNVFGVRPKKTLKLRRFAETSTSNPARKN